MDDPGEKPIVWLHGEIRTPPFTAGARVEAGWLLRRLQNGERLSMPHSRPMQSIGGNCHELRVNDERAQWRVIYRIEPDAIVVLEVFAKQTAKTPRMVIDSCKRRLSNYLRNAHGD